MTDTLTHLTLDFLEWIAVRPRSYAQAMDVWRTSCPRLPIWEDAIDQGLVVIRRSPQGELRVDLTPAGGNFLAARGGPGVLTER